MKNKNKSIIIIIILLLAVSFRLMYNKITITSFLNDSGFDSSYSGGHHSSGGSSHSRSSSRSRSSSSHSRSSSSSNNGEVPDATVGLIVILCLFIPTTLTATALIIVLVVGGKRHKGITTSTLSLDKSKAWTKEQFEDIIKDIKLDDFLFERIADLVQVQYGWMNFDYDKLRDKLTDELYNQYEMQLNTLKTKGQKNVMNSFETIDSMVTNVENINGRYTVTMELIIKFIDYIEENKVAVRGSSTTPITMHYELVFTSSSNGIVDKCPKCGGELKDKTSQECPYCKTKIVQDSTKWVMSKKKALGQR